MRRLLTIMAVGLLSVAYSQKTNTTNAAMAYKAYEQAKYGGDYEQAAKELIEAKEFIDQSIVNEETVNDPKTHMYYGFIYCEIPMAAQMSGDETLKSFDMEESMRKGFDALKKSKELDTKGRYEDDVNGYCDTYRMMYANMGIKMYEEEKYFEAMGGLVGAAAYGEVMGLADSVYYFYGGLAAFKIDSFAIAEEAFQHTVDWGYQPGHSTFYLSQSLQKQNKMAEAEKMLTAQAAKYPKDMDILIEVINFFIDQDRKEDAITFLNEARKIDPKNTVLTYTAGTIYENMGEFEKAEQAYNEVLAVEPDNLDATSAMGGLYFNKGADIHNEANKLEFGDPKHDEMVAESKEYFTKSVEFFEKANTLKPDDITILTALRDAYGKAGMKEKYLETKKKIESM